MFNAGYNDAFIPVDEIIGSVFRYAGNSWRIMTLVYDQANNNYSASAEGHTLCADIVADVGTMDCRGYIAQLTANFGGVMPTMQQYIDAPLLDTPTVAPILAPVITTYGTMRGSGLA
jgi:hypothetical protein